MEKTSALDVAFDAARALPESAQEALARDVFEQVEKYANSHLSDEQRAIVIARLRKPVKLASRESVELLFEKFTVTA